MKITENMSNEELDIITEKLEAGTLTPAEQLELCRRRINNFRQTAGLVRVIELCESEPMAMKINKVSLNIYAMLHFATLPDLAVSTFMAKGISEMYSEAFDYFKVPEEEKAELISARGASFPTTVELNNFLHAKIAANVDRINNLPESVNEKNRLIDKGLKRNDQDLYSAADIRERAIFFFAEMPTQEKMRAIFEINAKYGFLMTRLNDKQYENKRATLNAG